MTEIDPPKGIVLYSTIEVRSPRIGGDARLIGALIAVDLSRNVVLSARYATLPPDEQNVHLPSYLLQSMYVRHRIHGRVACRHHIMCLSTQPSLR